MFKAFGRVGRLRPAEDDIQDDILLTRLAREIRTSLKAARRRGKRRHPTAKIAEAARTVI